MKNTTAIGNRAESAVIVWLRQHKHKVIARNWRTKACEIDLISAARNPQGEVELYFTEVKMRSSADYGGGLGAITPAKLQKMRRATAIFLAHYPQFNKLQILLAAAEVDKYYSVCDFIILD